MNSLAELLRLISAFSLTLGFIGSAVPHRSPAAASSLPSSPRADVVPPERGLPRGPAAPEADPVGFESGVSVPLTPQMADPVTPTIDLKSRSIVASAVNGLTGRSGERLSVQGNERVHILVQLDFIPRKTAKEALADRGLRLLSYVPDNAWIASVPADRVTSVLQFPGVTWIGRLIPQDKLDPAIVADRWGAWNQAPDGTVAVYVTMHEDERLDTGRALVDAHDGTVTGQVVGTHMLVVEMPRSKVRDLAAEDAVQWIEPAAPSLTGTNDGSRPHIGVDVVQAPPYDLYGADIDVLIYDSGQVADHVDFGSRLTHGDSDFVSEHSTHVAGIVGGSGANSAAEGGSALQWRGMAPNVNLISYGTSYSGSGRLFYENVPDIEHDWAEAQNAHGADLANASLGSNVYANYYPDCSIIGKYGASSVLIDQIVRGGNSEVDIGDKFIATWAVGNERGWFSSCPGDGDGYGLIAPPAAAKNPIHVGASNTDDTSQYAHTSWGPTEDGRLKPVVTAGGCQTGGDGGIMSTDNLPVDSYTTMCGTTMAAPAVAGGIALMLQHYRDVYNASGSFWPSTAKAILMQTASDEGRPGPDYQWGYGLVDIHAAVDLISRKAFRQESIDAGEVDVYSLVVPHDQDDVRVSLAWDDVEATENANPTLINDLDLELVAPDGTVWEPWTLDPENPTDDATRGVNTVDNQEQVEVSSTQAADFIGTWMVRVRGTTVPEGPQDYSLVCEGCERLDVGACQSKLEGYSVTALGAAGTVPRDVEEQLSEGERWQRNLEGQRETQTEQEEAAREGWEALEAARQDGPEAVVGLLDTLRGPALDAVLDEIQEVQERLDELASSPEEQTSASAPPEPAPVSGAEEQAALELQTARDAENRAKALSITATAPEEGERRRTGVRTETRDVPIRPASSPVTRTVGGGCTHATIGAAIVAANPGDTLLIEGGVTFDENVTVPISLTLRGGYDGCASGSTDPTTVDGGASDRVFAIYPSLDVTLENLIITNGDTGLEGGGVRFAAGTGTGNLTLTNVDIHNNIGYWGGGLWVGQDAQVTGDDVQIYDNTSETYGGGVRLYGGRLTLENSGIYENAAPRGGGVYATQEQGHDPVLNLPTYVDLYDNQALTGDGFGGGLYLRQAAATLAGCSDLYSNDATVGGGAYLITSTLTVDSSCSEVNYNTATDDGGGVYAMGSSINLDEDAEIEYNEAGTGGSGSGGGAYLDDSNLYSDKASINNNTAPSFGGGVYAINGSNFDMDLGTYTCLRPRCSRLYKNVATGSYGGGAYLNNSDAWLDNTFVEHNQGTLGGGLYAYQSTIHLNNSLFARNDASSGSGDGVRLYNGSNLTGQGNTFAYNESGGGSTGQAIGVSSANLTLDCSIIWGHASSIDSPGEDVTYSDVQGGYAGEGNLDVDPQFVAPGGGDYHLQIGSPVVDRCVSGGSIDFDAEHRPIVRETAASPYDMGADEVSGAARVGLNDGGCAYATIQQAVNAAEDGDTLQVAEGVYFENVGIYARDITLAGGYDGGDCTTAGAGTTRVEGSAGSGSTFDVDLATVTLRDLEIVWGSGNGGGMNAGNEAFATLDKADVHDNHGTFGGGVYVGSTSAVTLTNGSILHDNTASCSTHGGGGARVWGRLTGLGTSRISGNCAPHGGGISLRGTGMSYLDGVHVQQNEAADATGAGGGIHVYESGVLTVANSTLSSNAAYNGGGVYNENTATIQNSTVSGNAVTNDGAGIYNSAALTARHSTLSMNSAMGRGGGMFNAGTLHLLNTLIADSLFGGDCRSTGTVGTNDHNLIEGNGGACGLTDGVNGTIIGVDPRLGPLADNGGQTWTHALQTGSPAIDAGSCEDADAHQANVDQRGMPRPQGYGCDIGAYEAQPELGLSKAVNHTTPEPGGRITYTVTVDNSSNVVDAVGGTISDTLPSSLILSGPVVLEPATAGDVDDSSNVIQVTDLVVESGEQVVVTIPVLVDEEAADGTEITNTATVAFGDITGPMCDSQSIVVTSDSREVFIPLAVKAAPR